MNKDFPELQQFLAGYFHQDWVDDYKNADEVIASFISESDRETITNVKQELNKLMLAEQSEQEIQDFLFYGIGCNYYYPHEWKNGMLWLQHVYLTLSEAKR